MLIQNWQWIWLYFTQAGCQSDVFQLPVFPPVWPGGRGRHDGRSREPLWLPPQPRQQRGAAQHEHALHGLHTETRTCQSGWVYLTTYKAFLANSNFVHFSKLQNPGILRTIIGLVWTYQWRILDNSFLFWIIFSFCQCKSRSSPGQNPKSWTGNCPPKFTLSPVTTHP